MKELKDGGINKIYLYIYNMQNENSVAFIAKITGISPITGADKIERVIVGGWNAIAQKGIHKPGDLVLCMTTDAVIPEELAVKWGVKNYLRKGNRVRTIKLKGVYSEVVLIPLFDIGSTRFKKFEEGADLMEILGVFKYEPPLVEVVLPGGKRIKQKDNLNFNKYYKFPNHKNTPNMFNEDDDVVVTRKIHGTSARFGICLKSSLTLWDKIRIFFGNKNAAYCYIIGSHNVIKSTEDL